MQYATFSLSNDPAARRLGAVVAGRMVNVERAVAKNWTGSAPASLLDLIQAGDVETGQELWKIGLS